MRSRAYFHYSSIPFPGGCQGDTMLWHLRVSSQLKGTFTKPEVLVEPLTFVTVHWNIETAISYSTRVSFRLNLETDDSGSLPEFFWHGGVGMGKCPSSVLPLVWGCGVFYWLYHSHLLLTVDHWAGADLQKHSTARNSSTIVSYSSLFQRDLRASTGSCHNCQHIFF